MEVKEKLSKVEHLTQDHVMISLMYRYYSLKSQLNMDLELINERWLEVMPFTPIKSKQLYMESLRLIITDFAYLKYDNFFFKQVYGIAMRDCMSVKI